MGTEGKIGKQGDRGPQGTRGPKAPRVSLGATVTQDSQDLLENRGLKVNLDNAVLQGNRVSKDSLDLLAYLVCPA